MTKQKTNLITEICQYHQDHMNKSIAEIAKRFGVNTTMIHRILTNMYQIRKEIDVPQWDKNELDGVADESKRFERLIKYE